MNSQEYLNFFQAPPSSQPPDSHIHKRIERRPHTTQYQRSQQQKLLPHITEQYQFRITNSLLDQKIKNPKRDRIIMQSLSQSELRKGFSVKKNQQSLHQQARDRSKQNRKSERNEHAVGGQGEKGNKSNSNTKIVWPSKRKQIERAYKTFDDINSPCHNYMNQYLIALENNRMGKRLINTRSVVQDILTKTYYTYQLYNGQILNRDKFLKIKRDSVHFRNSNKNFGKINNGIKSFFHKVIQPHDNSHQDLQGTGAMNYNLSEEDISGTMVREDKILRYSKARQNTHHGYETNNPHILQTFGQGQYNFIITKMIIQSNPQIKPETILIVQIVQKYHKLNEILNQSYAQKNNFFKYHCKTQSNQEQDHPISASFPYDYISQQSQSNFGIKFKVHKSAEIYLRILRNQGIEQREMGVVKIDLESLRTPQQSQFPVTVVRQFREMEGVLHERIVYQSEFQGKLLKLKKGLTSTEVYIEYSFYGAKFKKSIQQSYTKQLTNAI